MLFCKIPFNIIILSLKIFEDFPSARATQENLYAVFFTPYLLLTAPPPQNDLHYEIFFRYPLRFPPRPKDTAGHPYFWKP
jgi:hypothetical protein